METVASILALAVIFTACCTFVYLCGHRDGKARGAQEEAQKQRQAICRACGPAAAVAVAIALEEGEACERPGVN